MASYKKSSKSSKPYKSSVRRNYKKKTTSSKPSKIFKKKVMTILNKESETKHAVNEFSYTSFNSAISGTGDICKVIPNISRGNNTADRIGDKISLTKIDIRGHVIMNTGYNSGNDTRIGVRMLIVQPRNLSSFDQVSANAGTWLNNLLKRGNTTFPFNGTVTDLYSDVNTEAIICYHDKLFFLKSPYLPSGGTSTTQDLNRETLKMFRYTKTYKNKVLHYDANIVSDVQPSNYSPVLLLGYAHLDSSLPDTLSTQLSMQFNSVMSYEDN